MAYRDVVPDKVKIVKYPHYTQWCIINDISRWDLCTEWDRDLDTLQRKIMIAVSEEQWELLGDIKWVSHKNCYEQLLCKLKG